MPEAYYVCSSCSRAVRGRNIRSVRLGGKSLLVCRRCVPKFDDENMTYKERKLKLREQPFYEQQPLPF